MKNISLFMVAIMFLTGCSSYHSVGYDLAMAGNTVVTDRNNTVLTEDELLGKHLQVRVRNVGQQYLDNTGDEDRTIDAWTTFDLSFWVDLGGMGLEALQGARAFAHLRNLGDTEYETTGYYNPWGGADYSGENHYTPAAGRNFAVGVDYDF